MSVSTFKKSLPLDVGGREGLEEGVLELPSERESLKANPFLLRSTVLASQHVHNSMSAKRNGNRKGARGRGSLSGKKTAEEEQVRGFIQKLLFRTAYTQLGEVQRFVVSLVRRPE